MAVKDDLTNPRKLARSRTIEFLECLQMKWTIHNIRYVQTAFNISFVATDFVLHTKPVIEFFRWLCFGVRKVRMEAVGGVKQS